MLLAISAYEQVKLREREDFQDILDTWKDDPISAANQYGFRFRFRTT